jgi:acyl-CoA synthetase (AMP-forming)/AMP-acid ligase II
MSGYRDRPWLGRYEAGKPADITPEHQDALAMWRDGAGAAHGPFLCYFGTPVSGARVDADSDALAVALAARGLGRGDRVALFLQNVPQFVIALLAAWKLGAIAVPVNPMLKERELRYVLTDSGAKAIISLQDLWNLVGVRAVGGTEVTVAVTTSPFDYLDDEETPPVLAGVARQIATSGPMVVPGYWNKPDATARTLPGGELRTGDVGFMDADGWFYLVDRKKDMIVASGYKVWPREVEDALVRHPAVREAAVIGVPDDYRGETVWAYVSLRPGAAATPEELTAFCRAELAAYKYPRRIEILSDLPKTPTGKLLRRELRERAGTLRSWDSWQ